MLTRRGFAGVASCAICGLAGFVATDASAQGAPSGVTRKILSQIDGPIPGYTTISADVTLEPGAKVPRHTHPGIESASSSKGLLSFRWRDNRRGYSTRVMLSKSLRKRRMRAASHRKRNAGYWSPTSWTNPSRSRRPSDRSSRRRSSERVVRSRAPFIFRDCL